MYIYRQHLWGKGGLPLLKANLLGNACWKTTTIHPFPSHPGKPLKELASLQRWEGGGLLQISKKELTACMRQKRTSWKAGAWKMQVADLIDAALQKNWVPAWTMAHVLGDVRRAASMLAPVGNNVANFFCCGSDSKPTEVWTFSLEKMASFGGEWGAVGSLKAQQCPHRLSKHCR